MKKLFAVLFALISLFTAAAWAATPPPADKAFYQRVRMVNDIYGPYLEQIKFEDVLARYKAESKKTGKPVGKVSKLEFDAGKLALVHALADIYTMEDLQLQKRMAALVVGKRILGNVPRATNGLEQLPIAEDQFSADDWQAFRKLIVDNKDQFLAMNERLKTKGPAAFDRREREMAKLLGQK